MIHRSGHMSLMVAMIGPHAADLGAQTQTTTRLPYCSGRSASISPRTDLGRPEVAVLAIRQVSRSGPLATSG